MKKFFTLLTSFLPPCFALKITTLDIQKSIFCKFSLAGKGGKKLVRGVKKFYLKSLESQLSFAQKISNKSLKLAKIAISKFGQNQVKNLQFLENFQKFRFFSIFYHQNNQISF